MRILSPKNYRLVLTTHYSREGQSMLLVWHTQVQEKLSTVTLITCHMTVVKTTEDGATIWDYEYVPRGSQGRTPWVSRIDLNMMYATNFSGLDTRFKIDIFNLLNADNATRVNEVAETSQQGNATPRYGLPSAFKTPRYVQLSVNVKY